MVISKNGNKKQRIGKIKQIKITWINRWVHKRVGK